MILKEYRTEVRQDTRVQLGGTQMGINTPPGRTQVDLPGSTEYDYTMHDGPFKGRDPRDLIREAVQWWESELKAIEAGVQEKP